jgi:hypothetical protein
MKKFSLFLLFGYGIPSRPKVTCLIFSSGTVVSTLLYSGCGASHLSPPNTPLDSGNELF